MLRPVASSPHLQVPKTTSPPSGARASASHLDFRWRPSGGTNVLKRSPPPLPKGSPRSDELARERRSIMLHAFSYNASEDYNDVPPPTHSTYDYRHTRALINPQTSRRPSHFNPTKEDPQPTKHDLNAVEQSALQGRMVALHVATEEATRSGTPWSTDKTIRMHVAAKGTVNTHELFVSSFGPYGDVGAAALAELMDEGVEATRLRVVEVLDRAFKARKESERSEAIALHALRAMPHLEEDTRALSLQFLMRGHRSGERMRQAMYVLENETAQAQSVYAAERRMLATQLVAQREALGTILSRELADCENGRDESRRSIAWLFEALKRFERERSGVVAAFDARVAELEQKFEAIGTILARELADCETGGDKSRRSIQALREENQSFRNALSAAQENAAAEQKANSAKVARLEAEAAQHRRDTEKRARETLQQLRDIDQGHREQLKEVEELAELRKVALVRARETSDLEYARLNAALTRTITATEMAKEREVKSMQKKLKKLEALLLAAQRSKGN